MAFIKDRTTSANAAIMSSADITAALINAGVIKTVAVAERAAVGIAETYLKFAGPVVEADNAAFAAAESNGGSKTAKSRTESKSTSSSRGGSDISLTAAQDLELNSGPFKGVTLGEVYDMNETEAAEYDYKRGAGSDYVKWLSGSRNPNDFTRKFAKALLAGVGDDEE
jgi:hypothetical protein